MKSEIRRSSISKALPVDDHFGNTDAPAPGGRAGRIVNAPLSTTPPPPMAWSSGSSYSPPVTPGPLGIAPASGGGMPSNTGRTIAIVVGAIILVVVALVGIGMVMLSRALPDAIDQLGDLASERGQSYGDNSRLDGLWDTCADGGFAACDELYFLSEMGTEYERFADTCGNRNLGGDLCVNIHG